jgi:hypothetical protein
MSNGEIAFLALVVGSMVIFAAAVGFVSWWSTPRSSSQTSNSIAFGEAQSEEMSHEDKYNGQAADRSIGRQRRAAA